MANEDIVKKPKKVNHATLPLLLFLLLTAYFILPTLLQAQSGWGPDVQLTYRQGAGRDPRAACCGDTVHIVWWQGYAPGHDEVFYKRSTDAGETWEADVRLSEEDDKISVLPQIAVNQDYVHIVWQQQDVGICYQRSTNGGNSWLPIDTLTGGSGDPSICAVGSNVYVTAYRTDGKIIFFKSTDYGNIWLPSQVLTFIFSNRPRIQSVCSNPDVVVLTCEDKPYAVEIYFIRTIDGGNSWIDSQYVSQSDSISSQCPAIDSDDSTDIHITWYDYKYSPYPWTGDIFYRASRDSGNSWEPIDSLTTQHRARHSDILAEGNNLHVVWDDDRYGIDENNEILYRMSADLGQSWENDVRLTDAEGNSHNPALTCDTNYLHLFWCDCRDTTGDVAIYYKRKDLSQGVVELESLVPTLHLWFELYPTLFSKAITIRYSAWGEGQRGLNQAQDNPAMPYALCAKVYDITGKEVINKEKMEKGSIGETVQIDTKDLPCGVYFVELEVGKVREVHKVVRIK
jgi:hypothetical protein